MFYIDWKTFWIIRSIIDNFENNAISGLGTKDQECFLKGKPINMGDKGYLRYITLRIHLKNRKAVGDRRKKELNILLLLV